MNLRKNTWAFQTCSRNTTNELAKKNQRTNAWAFYQTHVQQSQTTILTNLTFKKNSHWIQNSSSPNIITKLRDYNNLYKGKTNVNEDDNNTIYQTKTNPELKSNRIISENQKSNKNCITKKMEKENPNQCKMKMRKTLYVN